MNRAVSLLAWLAVALLGAGALGAIAFSRGEPVNGVFFVVGAGCTYLVAYRFYSAFLAARVLSLDATRATPAERLDDGRDFVPTNRWVVLGHHFAAIAGPGPLVGPTLAAQFGYLPGTLWLVAGAVLGGCVQDFVILFFSLRRDGRSLGQMARDEVGRRAGLLAMVSVLAIMVILLAVVALVVVNALKHSPWGAFTLAMTIPIAMLMGVYMRFWRPGRVMEASAIGFVLILLAVVAGQWVSHSPEWAPVFTLTGPALAPAVIVYGFAASALPVWLLLAPRDYLSAFIKVGRGARPRRRDRPGAPDHPHAGPHPLRGRHRARCSRAAIFPFCFITIACGAISGFHALISSGTTPKLLTRESDARLVGYGSMLMESFVGVMAMVAACALEPGVYFAINSPAGIVGATAEQAASTISAWGFPLDPATMHQLARQRRRGDPPQPDRRRPLARRGHGAHLQRHDRRRAPARHLVPLRDHVRGALHPDRARRRDAGGALHGPGAPRPALPADRRARGSWTSTLVDQRPHRGRLGLLPLPGRARPAGRHQLAVAALRDREPDPGLGRARGRHDDPDQDGADALRVGHARAHGLAGHGHPHRQLAEGLPREPAHRLPRPGPGARAADRRRPRARGRRWPTPAG